MALTFPSSPSNGQLYTDTTTGYRYIYNATAGVWSFSSNNVGMSVSSTPPSNVAPGSMWFNREIGRTFVYYDDGDSQQWIETVPAGAVDTNTIAGYVNPVFASMNGAYTTANVSYGTANNAYAQANAAYAAANNVNLSAPFNVANASYNTTNTSFGVTNSAFSRANTAYTGANNASKSWMNYSGSGTTYYTFTTPYIRASYNMSSVTRNTTGDITVNIGTAFQDADYCISAGSSGMSGYSMTFGLVNSYNRQGSISSSAFRAWTVNNGNGTGDEAYLFVSIFR